MMISVTDGLLSWYNPDMRELPWKATRDPYKIWLSEIILQQTRVEQGRPYYLKFIKTFPNVFTLAKAPVDDVLKLWEGLGYYSRARNLHHAAKQIVEEYDGEFPKDYASLLKLKGVGEYTAAAIASFAYDEPVAVVDGNVFRFLSRLFGIAVPIDSSEGRKIFRQTADDVLNRKDPSTHNQAIMDFGALVCKPRNPECGTCPFSKDCIAFTEDTVGILPNKSKSLIKRSRDFNFYILRDEERVVIERRNGKDIWQGLWQFPLVEEEVGSSLREGDAGDALATIEEMLEHAAELHTFEGYRQMLSHQRIHANFILAEVNDVRQLGLLPDWQVIQLAELGNFAYPGIIRNFLLENADQLRNTNTSSPSE